MRLFAAIVPPRDVLKEVVDVVESVRSTLEPEPAPAKWWRRSGKGARGDGRGQEGPRANRELDRPDIDLMHIPITSFGNVTLGDSVKLVDSLRERPPAGAVLRSGSPAPPRWSSPATSRSGPRSTVTSTG